MHLFTDSLCPGRTIHSLSQIILYIHQVVLTQVGQGAGGDYSSSSYITQLPRHLSNESSLPAMTFRIVDKWGNIRRPDLDHHTQMSQFDYELTSRNSTPELELRICLKSEIEERDRLAQVAALAMTSGEPAQTDVLCQDLCEAIERTYSSQFSGNTHNRTRYAHTCTPTRARTHHPHCTTR